MDVLRHTRLCAGLDEKELARVERSAEPLRLASGDYVCRKGEPASRVCILVSGRLRATAGNGAERAVGWLEPGDSFGEVAVLDAGEYALTMTAAQDSLLLAIPADDFRTLFSEIPGLGRNIIRSLGVRLKNAFGLERRPGGPRIVGVVRDGSRGGEFVRLLAAELASRGERVATVDSADPAPEGVAPEERIHRLAAAHDRVIVGFAADRTGASAARLALCDEVLWIAEPGREGRLADLMSVAALSVPLLATRSQIVWLLPPDAQVAPMPGSLRPAGRRPIMVELADPPAAPTRRQRLGIRRLARHIRGITLGLALAGGGARGMAHLGVFRALERAGIDFDVMAGTSAGALVGTVYASGYSPDFAVEAFTRELSAPKWIRWLPSGLNWHLLSKFRSGSWDPTLRRYLFDWRLEQLPVPFSAVTVDLVGGREVVRDSGDAVSAVLTSINVPVISSPICRDGRAYVDGAVLNNLPADVLTRAGADFVVGVDVSSRLRAEFAGNTPGTPTARMRRPGFIETLFRVLETQAHGLTSLRTRSVDVMIEPDTSAFHFADFSQAPALADAGEAAAEAALPELRRALAAAAPDVSPAERAAGAAG